MNPVTRHSDMNGPICFVRKLIVATTWRLNASFLLYKSVSCPDANLDLGKAAPSNFFHIQSFTSWPSALR